MFEIKVTCLCTQYYIADMNLKLNLGDVYHFPPEKVQKSKDLLHAESIKAVKLEKVQRCVEMTTPKTIIPPYLRKIKPGTPPVKETPVLKEEPSIDVSQIVDQVANRVLESLTEKIVGKIQQSTENLYLTQMEGLKKELKEIQKGVDEESLKKILSNFSGGSVSSNVSPEILDTLPTKNSEVEDSLPVFIPSKIVREELKSEISIQETQNVESSSLDDASAALKALRKKNNTE